MAPRVALAIGVGKVGGLVPLPGAVSGAKDFHAWAKANGYTSFLVTDRNRAVTHDLLRRAIGRILKIKDLERLLLYFAGHGAQPTYSYALWLLSNWENDSDDAVNVSLSLANAKRAGLKQISVIADACRSSVQGADLTGGSSIFPRGKDKTFLQTQCDAFYAARLGEPAQEVTQISEKIAAHGVFSRCLMHALLGAARQHVATEPGKPERHVVTTTALFNYLSDAVPLESGKIPGGFTQIPDLSPGWVRPNDVYCEAGPLARLQGGQGPDDQAGSARAQAAATAALARVDRETTDEFRLFAESAGRDSFETRRGLTFLGAFPKRVCVRKGERIDLFEEGGLAHVRGYEESAQTVLVEFENGHWFAGCIFPHFVGAVVVRDRVVASVNYSAALRNKRDFETPQRDIVTMSEWTALMRQERPIDREQVNDVIARLPYRPHLNPTLGILASYAHEKLGALAITNSIAHFFAAAGVPVPFDIAMLATFRVDAPLAGCCPLLTQGWSFLDPAREPKDVLLLRLRRGLLRSFWTTLRNEEGRYLAYLVEAGEL